MSLYTDGWDRIFGVKMKAEIVETFRWSSSESLRGLVLYKDNVRLPGLIVVRQSSNSLPSDIVRELLRYGTEYCTVHKNDDGTYRAEFGPWAVVDGAKALTAILEALA